MTKLKPISEMNYRELKAEAISYKFNTIGATLAKLKECVEKNRSNQTSKKVKEPKKESKPSGVVSKLHGEINTDFVIKSDKFSPSQKAWLLHIAGFSIDEINLSLKTKIGTYLVWTYKKRTPERQKKAEQKYRNIVSVLNK